MTPNYILHNSTAKYHPQTLVTVITLNNQQTSDEMNVYNFQLATYYLSFCTPVKVLNVDPFHVCMIPFTKQGGAISQTSKDPLNARSIRDRSPPVSHQELFCIQRIFPLLM